MVRFDVESPSVLLHQSVMKPVKNVRKLDPRTRKRVAQIINGGTRETPYRPPERCNRTTRTQKQHQQQQPSMRSHEQHPHIKGRQRRADLIHYRRSKYAPSRTDVPSSGSSTDTDEASEDDPVFQWDPRAGTFTRFDVFVQCLGVDLLNLLVPPAFTQHQLLAWLGRLIARKLDIRCASSTVSDQKEEDDIGVRVLEHRDLGALVADTFPCVVESAHTKRTETKWSTAFKDEHTLIITELRFKRGLSHVEVIGGLLHAVIANTHKVWQIQNSQYEKRARFEHKLSRALMRKEGRANCY